METKSRYISYFQSVITVGILTNAKNKEEAEKLAKDKMSNKDGVNYCAFEQTDFEPTHTEEWNPEFELDFRNSNTFHFNPDDRTRNIIATRLQKNTEDLTEDDIGMFVKESLEKSLKSC